MPASLLLLLTIDGFPLAGPGPEAHHRQLITAGLLAALAAADDLVLTAAGTEDDALLLYRTGPVPVPALVLAQARHMFEAFHGWLADFQRAQPCGCRTCRSAPDLRLRIVAHAGPLALAAGHDPYGDAVWLLYDLLVDDDRVREYVLLTDALLGAEREAAGSWGGAHRGALHNSVLGEIGYVSVALRDIGERAALKPVPTRGSPFYSPTWAQELPGLTNRLALN